MEVVHLPDFIDLNFFSTIIKGLLSCFSSFILIIKFFWVIIVIIYNEFIETTNILSLNSLIYIINNILICYMCIDKLRPIYLINLCKCTVPCCVTPTTTIYRLVIITCNLIRYRELIKVNNWSTLGLLPTSTSMRLRVLATSLLAGLLLSIGLNSELTCPYIVVSACRCLTYNLLTISFQVE